MKEEGYVVFTTSETRRKMVKLTFEITFRTVARDRGKKLASRDDGNLNGYKAIGLDWQNNNFARASHFMYISLPSLHDYDVKMPNFTF